MPYRSSRIETPKRAPDPGIVDDMVRQFADRYAFMRELVQNGIDAGATRLEVRIERDDTGRATTSIDDDGSGMTRAIIEGPLLTLFSSSKEKDTTKIGKYGIGFVSVFALEPERVEVKTRREGEAWLVRLFGDHSYELLSESPRDMRARNGTTVTLIQAMTASEFSEHAARAIEALTRWCRHASVPIQAATFDAGDPSSAKTAAINEPMTVEGLVVVSREKDGERIVIGVSPDSGAAPLSFGGYYNRGLTLYETTVAEPFLEGLSFKVESRRLAHTLSRDNVRRDAEFRRVLSDVWVLSRELGRELETRLQQAAIRALSGSIDDYLALLGAFLAPVFFLQDARDAAIVVPLVEPIAGPTMSLRDLITRSAASVLVADTSSALTRALAKCGHPVVRHVALATRLRAFTGKRAVVEASTAFALATTDPGEAAKEGDDALAKQLVELLKRARRKVKSARFARFIGVGSAETFRVVDSDVREAMSSAGTHSARSWGGSATIFLNVEDAGVRLARRRAKTDAGVAAHLLCRAVLVADGPLDAKVVDRLLEAASE